MCGIAGIFDTRDRRAIDERLLADMTNSLEHRGPDGSGFHAEPGLGLGHRRLSIIDIDGGAQPMFNADRTVALTFNGEIYDFAALRHELASLGHRFTSNCDTEVIIYAWEEWGPDCLSRLDGMFAFALWDRRRETLFLARDRFGKKPLYYSVLPDGFLLFGSELKSLMRHPGLDRSIDATAVADYVTFGYVPDPKSIFSSVHKLEPGHSLLVERGGSPAVNRYWNISFANPRTSVDEAAVCSELTELLDAATRRRMIADVPLGAFLSGGVDSSAVVAAMSEISNTPVNTCSISFGDPNYNESAYAQQMAYKLGTDHRVEQVDTDDFDLVSRIPGIYDEPFADSSAIPTYRVCELARKHVTVALSGDGGDEVFAGYRRYRWHMNEQSVRNRIPASVRSAFFGTAGKLYPKLDWAPRFLRAKSTLQAIARDPLDAYLHSVSILPNDVHGRLFSKSFHRQIQGYSPIEIFQRHAKDCDSDDDLSLIQYLDMKTYLPGDILTKVDRASMAHSLEVRVPLLDRELTEWAGGLPSSLQLKAGEGKYIFKKASESRVPDSILYRQKMGFAVPLAAWFRGPLKESIQKSLTSERMRSCGIFDMPFVETLIRQHISGRRDHSPPIWALLVFDGFLRQLEGDAPDDRPS